MYGKSYSMLIGGPEGRPTGALCPRVRLSISPRGRSEAEGGHTPASSLRQNYVNVGAYLQAIAGITTLHNLDHL